MARIVKDDPITTPDLTAGLRRPDAAARLLTRRNDQALRRGLSPGALCRGWPTPSWSSDSAIVGHVICSDQRPVSPTSLRRSRSLTTAWLDGAPFVASHPGDLEWWFASVAPDAARRCTSACGPSTSQFVPGVGSGAIWSIGRSAPVIRRRTISSWLPSWRQPSPRPPAGSRPGHPRMTEATLGNARSTRLPPPGAAPLAVPTTRGWRLADRRCGPTGWLPREAPQRP